MSSVSEGGTGCTSARILSSLLSEISKHDLGGTSPRKVVCIPLPSVIVPFISTGIKHFTPFRFCLVKEGTPVPVLPRQVPSRRPSSVTRGLFGVPRGPAETSQLFPFLT